MKLLTQLSEIYRQKLAEAIDNVYSELKKLSEEKGIHDFEHHFLFLMALTSCLCTILQTTGTGLIKESVDFVKQNLRGLR
jgi:hypothetical protein